MNEKKAKALRRDVYGDASLRTPRDYVATPGRRGQNLKNKPGGLRAKYQAAKRSQG